MPHFEKKSRVRVAEICSSQSLRILVLLAFCMPLSTCIAVDPMIPPCEPVPYEKQVCYYNESFEINLDGNIDETAWEDYAHWEHVDYSMGTVIHPDNDADASYDFACVADSQNMYFAFRVRDDSWKIGRTETDQCNFYLDDSIEIEIDQDASGKATFDGNDTQMVLKAASENDLRLVVGGCPDSLGGDFIVNGGDIQDVKGVLQLDFDDEQLYRGFFVEVSIPLNALKRQDPSNVQELWKIEPYEGNQIGFQTGFNDRDDLDTMNRDHKLIWGKKDRVDDFSWKDPKYLGKIEFCHVDLGDHDTNIDAEPVTD